jgi:hypothetical protein
LKKGGKDIQNAETLLSEMIFCLNFMWNDLWYNKIRAGMLNDVAIISLYTRFPVGIEKEKHNQIKAFSTVLERFDHVEHIQYFFLLASFTKNETKDNLFKKTFLFIVFTFSPKHFHGGRTTLAFFLHSAFLNFMNVLFHHLCLLK